MLWLWLLFIINSYQHPLNILPTQHLTNILHTHNLLWCCLLDKINSYDSYQHPLNIIPTYYQHLSHGEPEDKLWGWVAYGLIVDKMWGICWFCPHKLPTFCRSCHCTTAPKFAAPSFEHPIYWTFRTKEKVPQYILRRYWLSRWVWINDMFIKP